MAIDQPAAPLSLPARPALTGGRRIGVLLSHGFTGSPYSIRPWGEALAEHGYAVEVPLLPGHGTHWRDLNGTVWADWYAEVWRALDRLVADNDTVAVGGLSMGAALVLQLAADRPAEVAGAALVNPAVGTMRKDVHLLPVLKHVMASYPAIANDIKKPGIDEHAYPRTPLKAAASMVTGFRALRGDLARVTAPLLIFRSAEDHVVDALSMRVITGSVSSHDVVERVLPDSYHVATLDNDAPMVFRESAEFVARVTAASLRSSS